MERASSEPPREGGVATGNPFYSKKVQLACEGWVPTTQGFARTLPGRVPTFSRSATTVQPLGNVWGRVVEGNRRAEQQQFFDSAEQAAWK